MSISTFLKQSDYVLIIFFIFLWIGANYMKKWELMNYSTDKIIYMINLNIDTHRTIEENIALYKLQNILQQFNYQVEIIDAWIEDLELDDLVNKLESNKTMFIGVTGCLANINEIKMFLDKLKKTYL